MSNIDHHDLTAKTEERATYAVERENAGTVAHEDAVIAQALEILTARMRHSGISMQSPNTVRDWLRLRIGGKQHEEFGCLWLSAQHELIEAGEMFRGTLMQTSVYPREVVKEALRLNAAAVIFYHNHPSGAAEPSTADELLTRTLKEVLGLVDVRVLDHFVVTAQKTTSFAEKGLL